MVYSMLDLILANELYSNILATIILIVILILIYLMIYALFIRHISEKKLYKKKRVRLLYTLAIIAIILLAKIWIHGFLSLIAVLSLVSAALVITNKEMIMNAVGAILINWRSLFSEGDFIKIGDYSGFVAELGPLYIKIFQASDNSITRSNGKIIKIPNGMAMTVPIINYSRKRNLVERKQAWLFEPSCNITEIKVFLKENTSSILNEFYQNDTRYSIDYIKMRSTLLASTMKLDVHIETELRFHEKDSGIWAYVHYYCFPADYEYLHEEITETIVENLKTQRSLQLLFHRRN